jgi:hypothetical protein
MNYPYIKIGHNKALIFFGKPKRRRLKKTGENLVLRSLLYIIGEMVDDLSSGDFPHCRRAELECLCMELRCSLKFN